MASIESLLNPLPESTNICHQSRESSTASCPPSRKVVSSRTKKPKMTKDAPVFEKGDVKGELRYPPYEEQDEELARWHRKFQIHPMGEISHYPRHIPYNSEKKSFLEKTGRESFEVFQYTFKIPEEEKIWTVMWDYNIGLVRTTHLFKCNHYPKTAPGKALDNNPGLRDISHSITGGALAAQGYWMPFEAAKAVAATFCWKIRYALTPLFGPDFPSVCISPEDRKNYGRMIIDSVIVRKATESANHYRSLETPRLGQSIDSKACTPGRSRKTIVSKPQSLTLSYSDDSMDDDDENDMYCLSPPTPSGDSFVAINTRRLKKVHSSARSPQEIMDSLACSRDDSSSNSTFTSEESDTSSMALQPDGSVRNAEDNEESDGDSSSDDTSMASAASPADDCNINTKQAERPTPTLLSRELKAAHALLSLHTQEIAPKNSPEDFGESPPECCECRNRCEGKDRRFKAQDHDDSPKQHDASTPR